LVIGKVACRKCGHEEVVLIWRNQGLHEIQNIYPFMAI
jgi:hypothetical protein